MGCTLRTNRHGYLAIRVWGFTDPQGKVLDSNEGTDFKDAPANRTRLAADVACIRAEIAAGRFDYLRWFPNGNKAALFRPARPDSRSHRRHRFPPPQPEQPIFGHSRGRAADRLGVHSREGVRRVPLSLPRPAAGGLTRGRRADASGDASSLQAAPRAGLTRHADCRCRGVLTTA